MVYAKDTLQLINYDEGRIRPVKINANAAASAANFNYVYDYFLKDHLGNVRMVITTESKTISSARSLTSTCYHSTNLSIPRRVSVPCAMCFAEPAAIRQRS